MHPVLEALGRGMIEAAVRFVPLGYTLGRQKAQERYQIDVPWSERDNVAVETLLAQNTDALAEMLARMDAKIAAGLPVAEAIAAIEGRLGSWSWVLSPALAMGLSGYIADARPEIARTAEEGLAEPGDIGVIWWNSRDDRVCPVCIDLTGRWFDPREAYELAASVHPGCRCPAHFDVGTPDEAVVGPKAPYRKGTIATWMRQYGVFA